jgi:acetylglutamate kinase
MRLVIKLAGALLDDAAAVEQIARQMAALSRGGHELLVIHGGGKIFTSTLARMGIESRFVQGLRVTDRETRDVAVMVFAGLLNKRLTAALCREGVTAVGISAADSECFLAEPMQLEEQTGRLGYVGYITGVNLGFLESLWRARIVPVACCLGQGPDGELYNINADQMAAACAEYVRADRLIFLTDVAGLLDGAEVVKAVTCEGIEQLICSSRVSGGMVLKLEACKRALNAGVKQVRIVGGAIPGALLKAANGARFPGTRVMPLSCAAPRAMRRAQAESPAKVAAEAARR